METVIPIETLHLFPVLDRQLILLLRSLTREDWNRPTRARLWTVKDVAAHLLDGTVRALSISRDGYRGEKAGPFNTYKDLVHYLNQLNAEWVKATKRMSPEVLIDLLETTGKEYHEHLEKLDPFAPAVFSVGWAGEETSYNWFHIAREYTEKWHHQQQIREAVHKPGIQSRELYFPVLNTFMQALPFHYRDLKMQDNTTIRVVITGDAGGEWRITSHNNRWKFSQEPVKEDVCITLEAEIAWKLFTKGLPVNEAKHLIEIQGNKELGEPIFSMVSVMA